jgi:hypothetical protein
MILKDAGQTLHLQGVLQAILANPDNFENKLTPDELGTIERFQEGAQNSFVAAELARDHSRLYLKLVNEVGANIPPAKQVITSEMQSFARSSWAA